MRKGVGASRSPRQARPCDTARPAIGDAPADNALHAQVAASEDGGPCGEQRRARDAEYGRAREGTGLPAGGPEGIEGAQGA